MASRYISLLAPLLVVAVAISAINCGREVLPEKLRKNLKEINKLLEANVPTDEVSANLAGIEKILEEKMSKGGCKLFGRGQSFEDTLRMLIDYAAVPQYYTLCDRQARGQMGEKLDEAVMHEGETRLERRIVDYHLTRLDKILAHVFREEVRRCEYYRTLPRVERSSKQRFYDWINDKLVHGDSDEKHFAEVERRMKGQYPTGAFVDAMRQFLDLKKTTSADTCNMTGYQILLANDIGTRKRAHSRDLRPVDKTFLNHVEQHERVCRPIYMDNFRREVQQLDAQTYRLMLALMNTLIDFDLLPSTSAISERKYEDLSGKEINGDFFTSFIEQSVRDELTRMTVFDMHSLALVGQVRAEKLYAFVKLVAASDANEKYLRPVASLNEDGSTSAPATVREPELKALLAQYLFQPCDKFLAAFQEQVEIVDYGLGFGSTVTDKIIKDDRKLDKLMTFNIVRGAVHACESIHYGRANLEGELIDLARTGGREAPIVEHVRLH